MKKRFLYGVFGLVLAAFPFSVFAYGWNWNIKNFNANVQINEDSSIHITEHIEVDFSKERHHGIFRSIPIKYVDTSGKRSYLRLKIADITDEKGRNWQFEQSYEGDFTIFKIGDPDRYINSIATFDIAYDVENAIASFTDHDEFYWNVTGDRWEIPIEQAQAVVTLPRTAEIKDLRAKCFTGQYGSKAQNCTTQISDGKTFDYRAKTISNGVALQGREGLTIVAGFPKNTVTSPTAQKKLLWFLSDNWGFFIPVVVLLFLLHEWYTKGRDPKIKKTAIMPFYKPPDDLTPGELGTLIDEKVDIRDISAGIIDLAVRGYLKIIENVEKSWFHNKKYSFVLVKKDFNKDSQLLPHEQQTLQAIFKGANERSLDDLRNEFYEDLPLIKSQIYQTLTEKAYFAGNPENAFKMKNSRISYIFLLFFAFVYLFGALKPSSILQGFIGMFFSSLLLLIFARFMPARTKKGVETRYKILGFEQYIKTAEKDRLKFQENINIFEKLLPYAMTLGIADKWSKTFEGIYKTPPSWYQSNDPGFLNNFSTFYLLSSLSSFSSDAQNTFQSSPRSSGSGFGGGGFSGGGGGGGGGGAW